MIILLLKATMMIGTNGSTGIIFCMTNPTQFVAYSLILDSIVVVFIYIPPTQEMRELPHMIFTSGPIVLF